MNHETNNAIVQMQIKSGLKVKHFCQKIKISQQYFYQIKKEKIEVSNSCKNKYKKRLNVLV